MQRIARQRQGVDAQRRGLGVEEAGRTRRAARSTAALRVAPGERGERALAEEAGRATAEVGRREHVRKPVGVGAHARALLHAELALVELSTSHDLLALRAECQMVCDAFIH